MRHTRASNTALLAAVMIGIAQLPAGAVTSSTSVPFVSAAPSENCGVQCTYLALRLAGRPVSMHELTGEFQLVKGHASMGQCVRALERRGLATKAVHTDDPRGLAALPSMAILPVLRSAEDTVEGHFLLYLGPASTPGMSAIATPDEFMTVSNADLERIWRGKALLISADPSYLDTWFNALSRSPASRLKSAAGSLAGVALLAGIWHWRRTRRKSPPKEGTGPSPG